MAELLVVATPIGNLQDMTARMREALTTCDLVAAEDTRVTMKLLNTLEIHKPMTACHRHNEDKVARGLVDRMLAEDLTVALTCDAGTPGISDPGVPLVRLCLEAGIRVTPVCGPCAFTAHLSACGFDAREFGFFGFPPREKKALSEKLAAIYQSGVPVALFYESPHRVVALCQAICQAWPACRLSVACDISKRYEKILTGPCADVLRALEENPNVEKGEYSVAADLTQLPPPPPKETPLRAEIQLLEGVWDGLTLEEAARRALDLGAKRNDVYRARLLVKSRFPEIV